MHHSTKRRVVLGMTTGGLLLTGIGMGVAQADASADGGAAHSPGLLSGNLIQVPVDAPINVCGNGVNVVGILDSVVGNSCANAVGPAAGQGASAHGSATDSPGVGSGNLIQIPVNAPINICGNQVTVVGAGNKTVGNGCANGAAQGSTGASANGGTQGSPGVGSGNTVQLPINAPINICGNQVSVLGIGDTVAGNSCSNSGTTTPPVTTPAGPGQTTPPPCGCHPTPTTPASPQHPAVPTSHPRHALGTSSARLAETGSGAASVMAPLGASVLGGGGLLLRKRMAALQADLTHRH